MKISSRSRIGRLEMGGGVDFYRGLGIMIVVGFAGPLLWLGIDLLLAAITRSLNRRANVWDPKQSRAKQRLFYYLARLWAVLQKPLF